MLFRSQSLRFGQPAKGGTIVLKMNERDLAVRAGMTRETVSRELSTLKNIVVLSREGFLIKDFALLEKELGRKL